MTDADVQKKLDMLTKIANELAAEGKRRWGDQSILFFEATGRFHLMSRDSDAGFTDRQEGVEFSSQGYCKMDCGGW